MRNTRKNKEKDVYDGITIEYVVDDELNIIRGLNKLGEYEDIDDELNVSWPTLYKALKNGFWHKDEHGNVSHDLCVLVKDAVVLDDGSGKFDRFYFEDYGKTWALTREELE